jgi:hypothetical protein
LIPYFNVALRDGILVLYTPKDEISSKKNMQYQVLECLTVGQPT